MDSRLSCICIILDASDGLFEETSVVGRVENKKVRLNLNLNIPPQLAAGFASASEKSSKLSSVIPRSLLRGASLCLPT